MRKNQKQSRRLPTAIKDTLGVQTIAVDARLDVGNLVQEVSVNASATLVQTETAGRSSTILGSTIKEMPLVGRDTYALTALLPGVNNGNGNSASIGAQGAGGIFCTLPSRSLQLGGRFTF